MPDPHSRDDAIATERPASRPVVVPDQTGGPAPAIDPSGDVRLAPDLASALAIAGPQGQVVAFIAPPRDSLAASLASHSSVGTALAGWKDRARAYLAALGSAPDRVVVIGHAGLARGGPPQGVRAAVPPPISWQLLAAWVLQTDPEARTIADDLDRMAGGPDAVVPTLETYHAALRGEHEMRLLLDADMEAMQARLEDAMMRIRLLRTDRTASEARECRREDKVREREAIMGRAVLMYGALADARRDAYDRIARSRSPRVARAFGRLRRVLRRS